MITVQGTQKFSKAPAIPCIFVCIVGLASGLNDITTCVGDTAVFNCTVPAEAHAWTLSTHPDTISITRASPLLMIGAFRFALVEDIGESIVTTLTVTAFAELDGVVITCDNALNPGQGLIRTTTVAVIGKVMLHV